MNILMIRKYISKMTLDDVKNMALKQGIVLADNEVSNVYKYIKSNYNSFFNGKLSIEQILYDAKELVSSTNYNKFMDLYLKNKDKI